MNDEREDDRLVESNPEDRDLRVPQVATRRREAMVGLFVMLGILAILVALFTFTSPSTFRGRYMLATMVSDAGGIRRGDAVQFRGVPIGRIRGFRMVDSGVVVDLEIEKRFRVPRDSRVEFSSNALVGGSVAEIVAGTSPEPAPPRAVLPGTTARPLPDTLSEVASESEKTMQRIQGLLSERTISGVEGSAEQLQVLLTELAETVAKQRTDLEQLTRSLSQTAQHTQKLASSPELEQSVKKLSSITTKLDDAVTSFDRASHSMDIVLGRIERGEGTLGRLSKDDSLYVSANRALTNLNQTATVVRALAMDINANPKRYINLSLF